MQDCSVSVTVLKVSDSIFGFDHLILGRSPWLCQWKVHLRNVFLQYGRNVTQRWYNWERFRQNWWTWRRKTRKTKVGYNHLQRFVCHCFLDLSAQSGKMVIDEPIFSFLSWTSANRIHLEHAWCSTACGCQGKQPTHCQFHLICHRGQH